LGKASVFVLPDQLRNTTIKSESCGRQWKTAVKPCFCSPKFEIEFVRVACVKTLVRRISRIQLIPKDALIEVDVVNDTVEKLARCFAFEVDERRFRATRFFVARLDIEFDAERDHFTNGAVAKLANRDNQDCDEKHRVGLFGFSEALATRQIAVLRCDSGASFISSGPIWSGARYRARFGCSSSRMCHENRVGTYAVMTTLEQQKAQSKARQDWMKGRGMRFASARKWEVLIVLGVFGILVAYGHWIAGLVVSTGLFVYRLHVYEKAYGVPPMPGAKTAAERPENVFD